MSKFLSKDLSPQQIIIDSRFRTEEDLSLEKIQLLNARKKHTENQRDKSKQEVRVRSHLANVKVEAVQRFIVCCHYLFS